MDHVERRLARYMDELRGSGLRMTRQRQVLLRVLAETEDHPDAAALHRRAYAHDETISLSTVYRTLKVLEARGAIQRHAFEDGRSRFEKSDGAHHDHLIDLETGQVIEFHSEKIEQLQAEIAAELGYDLVRHKLELYGVRRRARAKAAPARRPRA